MVRFRKRLADSTVDWAEEIEFPTLRAKRESLWPGEFRARSPLSDGRVDFGVVLSGYTNSGFAIAAAELQIVENRNRRG